MFPPKLSSHGVGSPPLRLSTAVRHPRVLRAPYVSHPAATTSEALTDEIRASASAPVHARTAMQKLRIETLGISGGRWLTRPFRHARRFPSRRWYPVLTRTRTPRNFGLCPSFEGHFRPQVTPCQTLTLRHTRTLFIAVRARRVVRGSMGCAGKVRWGETGHAPSTPPAATSPPAVCHMAQQPMVVLLSLLC
jgi:hypothetical protein